MASGKIKWFDNRRGYGFILDDFGNDVFLHYTEVHGNRFKTFHEGDNVMFEVVADQRGLRAHKVRRV